MRQYGMEPPPHVDLFVAEQPFPVSVYHHKVGGAVCWVLCVRRVIVLVDSRCRVRCWCACSSQHAPMSRRLVWYARCFIVPVSSQFSLILTCSMQVKAIVCHDMPQKPGKEGVTITNSEKKVFFSYFFFAWFFFVDENFCIVFVDDSNQDGWRSIARLWSQFSAVDVQERHAIAPGHAAVSTASESDRDERVGVVRAPGVERHTAADRHHAREPVGGGRGLVVWEHGVWRANGGVVAGTRQLVSNPLSPLHAPKSWAPSSSSGTHVSSAFVVVCSHFYLSPLPFSSLPQRCWKIWLICIVNSTTNYKLNVHNGK